MIPVLLALGTASAADDWKATLERVTASVVSIRMDRPRAYEGNNRGNSQATGFVIDDGWILTNRHVVTPGPVVARAIFLDQEEVDLVPVYRDPVHDFGLFRYDPDDLRFHEAPPLELRPDLAQVGTAIRVIGNDAGEKLSILDGTLARLDRPAPRYGAGYNDVNTFYVQAASSTSGGSSGSPVVDIGGRVVALNAGGSRRAASSFYLPLDRVVRAVALLKAGEPVPRGSIQATLEYEPYDALGRLGLSDATEAAWRADHPHAVGMLVVREVLPGGPARERLAIGDVLLALDDTPVPDFVTFEGILDDAVGQTVRAAVERAGERVEVDLTVGDLHALVPSAYAEVGGAVLHDLSLHHARSWGVPVAGVYVADTGYTLDRDGLWRGAVIVGAAGQPTRDLGALQAALQAVPDGHAVDLRWFRPGQPKEVRTTATRMDRTWFPARTCVRDDTTGDWPCTDWPAVAAATAPPPPAVPPPMSPERRLQGVASALVGIDCDLPYRVAGAPGENYVGGGVVVDRARGWVLVDRDTVPVALADVQVTFGGAVRVPARVVALHPEHDVALVGYDPAAIPGVTVGEVRLAERVAEGDAGWHVNLDAGRVKVQAVTVDGFAPVSLPLDGPPRFRESNVEQLELDARLDGGNGPIVDKKGRMLAFHASMSYHDDDGSQARWGVLPVSVVHELVALAEGRRLGTLPWELTRVPLTTALERGLPSEEAEALLAHDPDGRHVLMVARSPDPTFELGELVLAIDGRPVTTFAEVDAAVRGATEVRVRRFTRGADGEPLFREGPLPTAALAPVDVDRVLLWAGLRIHMPHRAARFAGLPADRPYIAWWNGGSPAGRAKIYAVTAIDTVNGAPVADLDALLAAVKATPEGDAVRLGLLDEDGEETLATVEPDERFWPTVELVRRDGGWERVPR